MEIGLARLPTDRPEIERLLIELEAIDGHRPIGEHKALGLTRPGPDLVSLVGRSNGQVVAFVPLTVAGDGWWAMEMAVVPGYRREEHYRLLFEAAVKEVVDRGGKALRAWLFQPRLATAAVGAGFSEERQLFKMERHLPFDRPFDYSAGVELRTFRLGHDERAWLELNNEAFAGHPENGAWTAGHLQERFEQDWFDPELILMAWHGLNLIGFNWLKIKDREGEIYVIAVSPNAQGEGLGRALIVDGLDRLVARGAERAYLYVDADNHRALRLYRDLGFYLDHVDRSFLRVV